MEFLREHWLSIGTAVFLLAMVLYGHYRGFLRLAVSMVALVLTLVVVRVASPYMAGFLRDNTPIAHAMEQSLLKLAGADTEGGLDVEQPSDQRSLIESLRLPEQIRESLLENNNNEVYSLLGVDAFIDYVGAYLANMALNILGSILLFAVVYIGIRLIMSWLNVIARLPILYGMNQIAGAILGGIEGLMLLWIFFLVATACAGTTWGRLILHQIEASLWLTFLYKNNIFHWLIAGILSGMI